MIWHRRSAFHASLRYQENRPLQFGVGSKGAGCGPFALLEESTSRQPTCASSTADWQRVNSPGPLLILPRIARPRRAVKNDVDANAETLGVGRLAMPATKDAKSNWRNLAEITSPSLKARVEASAIDYSRRRTILDCQCNLHLLHHVVQTSN